MTPLRTGFGEARDNALGDFLRVRRSGLTPAEAGLPARNGGRRTPGLCREEVAVLTGISVGYYSRLEQGRARHPSVTVAEALARGLRLDPGTRRQLYHLAGLNPGLAPYATNAQAHPRLRRLLEQAGPTVAFILSPCLDLLAANAPARAVLSPLGKDPNPLRALFARPPSSAYFTDRESVAHACLAALRASATDHPDDPGIRDLIDELSCQSTDFVAMWQRAESAGPHGECATTVIHPATGRLTLTFRSIGEPAVPGQRLIIGVPAPGSRDAEALTFLTAMTVPA
ncbi:helix-turn-helix transcriptional regulator [Streptomyces sp. CRN 30]|uniref:helix-turn-helix transcriptional regulator n=1 Tax=Streptomyces sp. CRN 30 TaxID=3075613 RepID=UPI002A828CCB|nr:helix-turn-helix transcriptional regulator [Streptomyces sp. CRN 30]